MKHHRPSPTRFLLPWVLLLVTFSAPAQTATPSSSESIASPSVQLGRPLQLQASDQGGQRFSLSAIKGKVAVVFFWSTDCAVCRNSLPELRANLAGWRDKPFALITVNVNRRSEDWLAYERLLAQTQPAAKGLLTLHQESDVPMPGKLPWTLLVDSDGKVITRFEGRLAPEVWDGVAELLP